MVIKLMSGHVKKFKGGERFVSGPLVTPKFLMCHILGFDRPTTEKYA